MDRFTISLDEELAAAFDELIKQRGYTARSEAVRDILRDLLQRRDQASDSCGFCVASLSYVYNHHERQLSDRLANLQHDHHDLTVATMHVHLDHEQCLETAALKGSREDSSAIRREDHRRTGCASWSAESRHCRVGGGA
jgi:CopG family transcriptional regulator, nickel-responsive regulator